MWGVAPAHDAGCLGHEPRAEEDEEEVEPDVYGDVDELDCSEPYGLMLVAQK